MYRNQPFLPGRAGLRRRGLLPWPPRTRAALSAVLFATPFLIGCEPGDITWLACLFGDKVACEALLNPPPPPPPPVPGPPAAPTGLTASITDTGGVQLDWNDNSEADLDHYTVYRATYGNNGEPDYTTLGTVEESEHLDDLFLSNDTTYFYVVTATDVQLNESARSAPVSLVYCSPGTTCHGVPGPPAAPTGLVAIEQDEGGLTLHWNANTEGDLDHYLLYRATAPGAYSGALFPVPRGDVPVATISASFYGLVPFTTYFFVVTAIDTDGDGLESQRSAELRVLYCPPAVNAECPRPPGRATGLRLVSRDASGISLDWDDVPGTNVARYVVYRSPFLHPESPLTTTTASSLLDSDPDDIFHNVYAVAAADRDGRQGPRSDTVDVLWCGPSDPTCGDAPQPAIASVSPARPLQITPLPPARPAPGVAAKEHEPLRFVLTAKGALDDNGELSFDGDSLVASGRGVDGTFVLDVERKHLDRDLKRLSAAELNGTWRARFDWRLFPAKGKGTTSGIALATFADPAVGAACLRFEETLKVKHGRKPELAVRGRFELLGGTDAAARLLGGGEYSVDFLPDGSRVYQGKAKQSHSKRIPPLPAECAALQ